jgi:GMP synthase-like glutamine amidotransferase
MGRILFIDMWPDELPPGVLRPRYADVPACVQAHGHELVPIHHRQLPSDTQGPLLAVIISGSRTNLVDELREDPQDGRLLSEFAGVEHFLEGLPEVLPVLGICFGHQFLAKSGGGRLERMARERDENDFPLREAEDDPLLRGLGTPARFVESHGWRVAAPGAHYRVVARSDDGIEMVRHERLPRVGVQFHPEYFARQVAPRQGHADGRIFLDNWLRQL